ncbi:hypothetical protein F442_22810, partial [Phytophthora nicotianae P10297]
MDSLRELVVEIEGLRNQNIALRKRVGLCAKFQQVLMEARQPKSDDLILPIAVKS